MNKVSNILLLLILTFGISLNVFTQERTAGDYFREGLRLARQGQIEEALDKFRKSAELKPNSSATFANIGQALYSLKRFDEAAEAYREAARLSPRETLYLIKLADIYLLQEMDSQAIAAANKAVEIDSDNAMAHYFLGKTFYELGQHTEAKASLKKVTEISPEIESAWFYLGISEKLSGNVEGGINAFRKLVEISPNNFRYNQRLGEMLNSAARYEDAVIPLKKAVSLRPKDFYAKVGLGLALFESANYQEGIDVLTRADQMKPGNKVVNMFLGVARARQEDFFIIDKMKEDVRKNPQDIHQKTELVVKLVFARRMDEAEPFIQEILKTNPKDQKIYTRLSVAYSTAGKHKKAKEVTLRSLKIKENPGDFFRLASYYSRQGRIAEAITAYEKVLSMKSDVPGIMRLYADLLRDNGKKREALAMYKRSLALDPNQTATIFNAGMLSVKFGEINSAKQYLERLRAIDPTLAKTLARYLKFREE